MKKIILNILSIALFVLLLVCSYVFSKDLKVLEYQIVSIDYFRSEVFVKQEICSYCKANGFKSRVYKYEKTIKSKGKEAYWFYCERKEHGWFRVID